MVQQLSLSGQRDRGAQYTCKAQGNENTENTAARPVRFTPTIVIFSLLHTAATLRQYILLQRRIDILALTKSDYSTT
jgi:hypothetical protein